MNYVAWLALSLAVPIACAQPLTYTLLGSTGPAPSPRVDGVIAYDAASRRIFLFGGSDTRPTNDLWAYSLATRSWTELRPEGALPPARFGHAGIFDAARGRFVIFGGQGAGFFSDVWAYDAARNTWQRLAAGESGPSNRYGHSAIYDPPRDRMVISHGFTDDGRFDDTWAFDLATNSWRNITPAGTRPLRRCLHHAVFDSVNQAMLLYGGCASGFGPCPLGDLWSFDLVNHRWNDISVTPGPVARQHYGMAFDAVRERVILFGGSGAEVGNQTWSYQLRTRTWQLLEPENAPSPRSRLESTYATDRGNVFFFGGTAAGVHTNELWMLGPAFLSPTPRFNAAGVGNTFTGVSGAVAPGELISIYGTGLGPLEPIVFAFDEATGVLPTSGPGVQVTWNGIPAPLYYASSGQLNVQVPYELAGAAAAQLVVSVNGQASDPVALPVAATRPQLFPLIWNQDGTINSRDNPAPAGSIVVLYATGQGVTVPASRTGAYPTGNLYPPPAAATSLLVNGTEAELLFRGQAPFTAGLMQINARLPGAAAAESSAVLKIGNGQSLAIPLFAR